MSVISTLKRPVKEQSRARDPRQDALKRHEELSKAKPEVPKKRDYSRPQETDPLRPAGRVAHVRTATGQDQGCKNALQHSFDHYHL